MSLHSEYDRPYRLKPAAVSFMHNHFDWLAEFGARAATSSGFIRPQDKLEEQTRGTQSVKLSGSFTCTLLALVRKSLIISGAVEGNRTLVFVQSTHYESITG